MKYLDSLEDQDSISEERRKYVKIYKKSKYGKVTRATMDKWIAIDKRVSIAEKRVSIAKKRVSIAEKGLKRFEKNGLIKIETCKRYDKIYLRLPEEKENAEVLFTVENKNPMIDFYLHTKDVTVKECVICHKLFPVSDGNVKTCSPKCSRINELRNKNKQVLYIE